MTVRARTVRWSFLAGIVCLVAADRADAAPNPATCTNDIDCAATPQCGGDVCTYGGAQTCTPAGTGSKGQDGWCTVDSDCKCASLGAKCVSPFCTFTRPSDAPDAGGSGGAAGGGAGSTGHAGSTGSGGTTTSSGGGGGGCVVAGSPPLGWPVVLGVVGLIVASRRCRAGRRN